MFTLLHGICQSILCTMYSSVACRNNGGDFPRVHASYMPKTSLRFYEIFINSWRKGMWTLKYCNARCAAWTYMQHRNGKMNEFFLFNFYIFMVHGSTNPSSELSICLRWRFFQDGNFYRLRDWEEPVFE